MKRIGVATIQALDEKGRVQKVILSGCLISPLFPFKLLSLQTFTKKGHVITIERDYARIANKINDVVLVGVRDPVSKLFLLKEAVPVNENHCWLNLIVVETMNCCGSYI